MQTVNKALVVGTESAAASSAYSCNGKQCARKDLVEWLLERGIDVRTLSRFVLLQSKTLSLVRQGYVSCKLAIGQAQLPYYHSLHRQNSGC